MMFHIGKITQTFGLKGEVKILSNTDYDRFKKGHTFYVEHENAYHAFEIERARFSKARHIVKMKGIDDINDSLWLVGKDVFGPKIETSDHDDFHFSDLIGKSVCLKDGKHVGVCMNVIEVPQGHILEIEVSEKKVLIPFVKAFIGPITKDSITIYPIEGML